MKIKIYNYKLNNKKIQKDPKLDPKDPKRSKSDHII